MDGSLEDFGVTPGESDEQASSTSSCPPGPADRDGPLSPQNGPAFDYDTLDVEELYAVKLKRALTDPFVGHTPSIGYAPDDGHYLYDVARKVRLAYALALPPVYRRPHATWPEIAIYCASASGDARTVTGPMVQVFTKALQQVLMYQGLGEDALPARLQSVATDWGNGTVGQEAKELARGLSEHIKDSQDSAFVGGRYHDWGVEGVPKRFWTRFASVTPNTDPAAGGQPAGEPAAAGDDDDSLREAALDEFV